MGPRAPISKFPLSTESHKQNQIKPKKKKKRNSKNKTKNSPKSTLCFYRRERERKKHRAKDRRCVLGKSSNGKGRRNDVVSAPSQRGPRRRREAPTTYGQEAAGDAVLSPSLSGSGAGRAAPVALEARRRSGLPPHQRRRVALLPVTLLQAASTL